jgi:hypothetical protein
MSHNTIEFVCFSCAAKENIPKTVVDDMDLNDFGGDLRYPPRFSCDSCPNSDMYPTFYKSLRGQIYRFNPKTREFSPKITP